MTHVKHYKLLPAHKVDIIFDIVLVKWIIKKHDEELYVSDKNTWSHISNVKFFNYDVEVNDYAHKRGLNVVNCDKITSQRSNGQLIVLLNGQMYDKYDHIKSDKEAYDIMKYDFGCK